MLAPYGRECVVLWSAVQKSKIKISKNVILAVFCMNVKFGLPL
jgi:hypothetical protein